LDIQENITDAIEYTKGLFTDLARLVILIVLDIIPIVNFIVIGYFARCVKESPASRKPPKIADYGDLWVQGAKIFLVSLVYMIIPAILFIPVILMTFAWGLFWGFLAFNWPLIVALAVVGLIISFLSTLILAMAIVNMIKKDDLGKAFALSEILDVIKRVGWGNYILWAIVIFGVFVARSAALVYLEGAPEVTSQPTKPEFAATVEAGMKYCKYCGAKIPADALYCPNCGGKQ